MLNAMNLLCQCDVERNQITRSQFACSAQDSVSFFSTINGTSQVPTSELLGYLESWVASGAMAKADQSMLLGCDYIAPTESPGKQSSGVTAIILYIVVATQFSAIIILTVVLTATLLVRRVRVQEGKVKVQERKIRIQERKVRMQDLRNIVSN